MILVRGSCIAYSQVWNLESGVCCFFLVGGWDGLTYLSNGGRVFNDCMIDLSMRKLIFWLISLSSIWLRDESSAQRLQIREPFYELRRKGKEDLKEECCVEGEVSCA